MSYNNNYNDNLAIQDNDEYNYQNCSARLICSCIYELYHIANTFQLEKNK